VELPRDTGAAGKGCRRVISLIPTWPKRIDSLAKRERHSKMAEQEAPDEPHSHKVLATYGSSRKCSVSASAGHISGSGLRVVKVAFEVSHR
jgi:hypothetical protein